jgi:hypothetical protein
MAVPIDSATKATYLRFKDEEIEGFLRFLLEGGADKQCSNVYRIIEQQQGDILEARRLIRFLMESHRRLSPSQMHVELHTILQVLS